MTYLLLCLKRHFSILNPKELGVYLAVREKRHKKDALESLKRLLKGKINIGNLDFSLSYAFLTAQEILTLSPWLRKYGYRFAIGETRWGIEVDQSADD